MIVCKLYSPLAEPRWIVAQAAERTAVMDTLEIQFATAANLLAAAVTELTQP